MGVFQSLRKILVKYLENTAVLEGVCRSLWNLTLDCGETFRFHFVGAILSSSALWIHAVVLSVTPPNPLFPLSFCSTNRGECRAVFRGKVAATVSEYHEGQGV